MIARLALAAALILLALPAAAQSPASLVADRVAIGADGTLTAEGDVEVFYEGTRLTAERVTYDRAADTLDIAGPIRVAGAGGGATLYADAAALSPDLREGILSGARLVLDRRLQLAAAEIARAGGRYTQLSRSVASSCRVCNGGPPLWQIRARRIVHDQAEHMLYFDNARFELAGVPILYLPRLRLPDPTRERANGFLVPEITSTSQLGTGIRVPYFITLGRHADLTLAPYVSGGRTRTLGLRYRQAFARGDIAMTGALSHDDIRPSATRGYLFAEGGFDLTGDTELAFDIDTVSDDAYLLDYGLSDVDRLESELSLTRTKRDSFARAGVMYLESLRGSEEAGTVPALVAETSYERRLTPPGLGGTVEMGLAARAFKRNATRPTDGPDADLLPDGRDVARATARLDWRRDWTVGPGLRLTTGAGVVSDIYAVRQDVTLPDTARRTIPRAEVTLRWPLVRRGAAATHVLEPVAQLAWSGDSDAEIPVEESPVAEFDEGNLFAESRFPGAARRPSGLRATLGLGWTRTDRRGRTLGLTLGRVIRAEEAKGFAAGSGLSGASSDWLVSTEMRLPGRLSLANRVLVDDDFALSANELRLGWRSERAALASTVVWRAARPAEARPAEARFSDTAEWTFAAAYRLRRHWTGSADWRYDFAADRAARAGLGVEYRNECITVDLSLSRRFTSSANIEPSTDFGISVALAGFGAREGGASYRRRCRR